jgi:hypothetical protein
MANVLTASAGMTMQVTLKKGDVQNTPVDSLQSGNGAFGGFGWTLTQGSGSGKASLSWHRQSTLAPTITETWDLVTLTDAFGAAVAFTKVKWFLVRITVPVTGIYLIVGAAAATIWSAPFGDPTDTVLVRDTLWMMNAIDGWTVSGANKFLKINNPGATTVVYDIVIVGE